VGLGQVIQVPKQSQVNEVGEENEVMGEYMYTEIEMRTEGLLR
jgi:hypothetical protein